MKVAIGTLVILGLFVFCGDESVSGDAKWAPDFYNKVPPIKISSPEGVDVGSLIEGQDVLTLGIKDVGLYTGHICICVASSYRIAQLALKALYGEEIPVRGDIQGTAGKYSETLEVISCITGIKEYDTVPSLFIDEDLIKEKRVYNFIFKRLSTGKEVMVTFFKKNLMNEETRLKMRAIQQKIENKQATEKEKDEMRTFMQDKVKVLLLDEPGELFEVKEIK